MPADDREQLCRDIAGAEQWTAAQRAEADRLRAGLAQLNDRLGRARQRQEAMQRPSTLVREIAPQRWVALRDRLSAAVARRIGGRRSLGQGEA